jgi:hypothetical protein
MVNALLVTEYERIPAAGVSEEAESRLRKVASEVRSWRQGLLKSWEGLLLWIVNDSIDLVRIVA